MASANCVAMDCEMIGGVHGENIAARVSLVDECGQVILDSFIKPSKPVGDYRTAISGITPSRLNNGKSLQDVRSDVARLINGRILVGHSLQVDLGVLGLGHPEYSRRDLATYDRFKQMNHGQPASLQFLAQRFLGRSIQRGQHDSVEDAKAAMEIYRKVANEWRQ